MFDEARRLAASDLKQHRSQRMLSYEAERVYSRSEGNGNCKMCVTI